jgi:16S rRNA (guanine527-N7)-methyltransferase
VSEPPQVLLETGLAELGLAAGPATIEALVALAEHVAAWGQRINLSGHRSADQVVRRLVLDAAALLAAAPPFESLADLGSGAGFPGLPIAILRPELRVTLVEARERRHHFQRFAVRQLALSNVRALRGRAEELEPELHAAAVAQAIASPERAVAWMLPWVRVGGWLLLPGGEDPPRVPTCAALGPAEIRRYRVPGDGVERTLWLAQRRDGG